MKCHKCGEEDKLEIIITLAKWNKNKSSWEKVDKDEEKMCSKCYSFDVF